jgi:hypothetical protein
MGASAAIQDEQVAYYSNLETRSLSILNDSSIKIMSF